MAPSLAVPPFATVASFVLVCGACASTPSDPAPRCPIDHPGHVRLDLPGRGLTDVPLDAIAMPVGTSPGVAELCGASVRALSIPGVYHGSSGAPVFRDDELVGGLSMTQEVQQSDLGLGFRPIATIRDWTTVARAWSPDDEPGPVIDTGLGDALDDVEPGTVLRFLTVWGDLEADMQGTVTDRDGETLSLLSHAPDFRPRGARHRLLQRARPLEISSTWWHGYTGDAHRRHHLISAGGPIVGRTYFECEHGVVGEVGRMPPHFRVDVDLRTTEAQVLRLELYVAANGPQSMDRYTIEDALAPYTPADFEVSLDRREASDGGYAWPAGDDDGTQDAWVSLHERGALSDAMAALFESARPGDHFRLRSEGPSIPRAELDIWRAWR